MEKSQTVVYIVDDELIPNHPICIKLGQFFNEIKLFKKSSEAIREIEASLGQKIILILDLKLSGGESGYQTLISLRKYSYLIPVIIWTAMDEKTSEFFSLINLKTYAIRDKDESIDNIVELVRLADKDITYSLSNALERWIRAQPGNHDEDFIISTGGETYSLNNMLNEIRKDTPKGKEFTQDLVNLTIELMKKNYHE